MIDLDHHRCHLEQVSTQYGLRMSRLCDWASPLELVEDREAILEHYLGALDRGGSTVLELAQDAASPADPGSYFAMMSLACRLDQLEVVHAILLDLEQVCSDTSTDAHAAASLRHAVADALVRYLPRGRAELMKEALRDATPHVLPVLAHWLGVLGWEGAASELRDATARPSAAPSMVLRALGRLPGGLPPVVRQAIDSPDPDVAQTAAIVALRHGDASVLDHLANRSHAAWTALPIAMGGGLERWPWLRDAAGGEEPSQALLALGIFGEPSAVEILLHHLEVEAHTNAAAIALFLLTGAQLGPPAVRWATVDGPRAIGGDRAWASVEGSGISTDPAAWAQWWEDNRQRLRRGRHHRLGALTGPRGDLAVLSSGLPLWLRRCLADELVIRYGLQWSYEPDMLAVRQRIIIERTRARFDVGRRWFVNGEWCWQGHAVERKKWARSQRHNGARA